MKPAKLVKIMSWIAVLFWMAVIFTFSAQNAADSSRLSKKTTRKVAELSIKDFNNLPKDSQAKIIKKLDVKTREFAHLLLYTVLGMLTMAALLGYKSKAGIFIAFAMCVLYAASDEVHQIFVEERGAELSDFLIDTGGAVVGMIFTLFLKRIISKLILKQRKMQIKTRPQIDPN